MKVSIAVSAPPQWPFSLSARNPFGTVVYERLAFSQALQRLSTEYLDFKGLFAGSRSLGKAPRPASCAGS